MKLDRFIDVNSYHTAKKGRRFVVMLIDYFLVLLVSFSIYALVAQPIFNGLPSTKETEKEYQEKQDDVLQLICSTHLQKKDEKENLVAVSKESENYVRKLLRYSCSKYDDISYYELDQGKKKYIDLKKEEKLSYQDQDGYYINDDILYYYLGFRTTNISSYSQGVKEVDLYRVNTDLLLLKTDNKDLIPDGIDLDQEVFYLNHQNTEIVLDYLNNRTESGKSLYRRLADLYRNTVLTAIQEVEKSYLPYLEKSEAFDKVYRSYSSSLGWTIVISYVIGFLLCYVPFQVIFRYGRTIGYRFFSLASISQDQMELRFWQILVKDLILFVMTFSSVFFIPLLLGKINLWSSLLFGSVSLFQVILFSFLMVLLSLIFFLLSKKNQTLSEFASLTSTVDLRQREEAFLQAQEEESDKDGKGK